MPCQSGPGQGFYDRLSRAHRRAVEEIIETAVRDRDVDRMVSRYEAEVLAYKEVSRCQGPGDAPVKAYLADRGPF